MSVLGMIAARGGSRRLPGKNVMPFLGRPLIAWSIRAALESGTVDRLLVSTDCPRIAAVAREAGAEVPFTRPAELAGDEASGVDVIFHALDWVESNWFRPRSILCLQATSPLRTAEDVSTMMKSAEAGAWREAAAFREADEQDASAWWLSPDGVVRRERPPGAQSLRKVRLNGAMYLIETDLFRRQAGFFGDHLHACVMPASRSIDIDTAEDFENALAEGRRMGWGGVA